MMAGTAAVFAGQGAQFVGMGRDLAEAFPACDALYARANDVLGYDLRRIVFDGPEEELTRSDRCQPAIFVTSVVCWTALRQTAPELRFDALAGLSLGEWTALHAAGVLNFDDALRILEARGRFMQEACEQSPGGMLSVMGLSPEALTTVCERTGVFIANLNSGEQTVLSGPRDAIADAERVAGELGAKRIVALNVAGAFHSPLMRPARERLGEVLRDIEFSAPSVPVVANVTGQPHPCDGDAIREAMLRQVTDSVRWLDSVRWCLSQGVERFIELGPGKVLSGLIRRIERGAGLHAVQDKTGLDQAVTALSA